MNKRTAIAGAAAMATGVSMGLLGLTGSPAAADAGGLLYNCGGPANFTTSVTITGSAPDEVVVGETVTLSGVTAVVDVPQDLAFPLSGGDGVSGSVTIEVAVGDGVEQVSGSIPETDSNPGGFTITAPDPAGSVQVTARETGELSFFPSNISATIQPTEDGQPLGGAISIECSTTGAAAISSTAVTEEPEPTEPPDDDTDTGGNGETDGPDPGDDGDTSGGDDTDNDGVTPPSGGSLARTGVDKTVPMIAGGAGLVLLGTGLLYYSRRRSGTETTAEAAE